MSDRIKEVVDAIVESVRGALIDKDVTMQEYRAGIQYLAKAAEAGEIPLMADVFFNIAVVENSNKKTDGTPNDIQGPYFIPDTPFVEGEIKTMEGFDGEPMLIQGQVTNTEGQPLSNAVLDIWQSTPDGKYSGFHDDIPNDYYRGKVKTNESGHYSVRSTVPVPYQIPYKGTTGALLGMMDSHTWRPAHIHFKANADGYRELTMQAYFEGGDYVGDDCCSGKCNEGQNVIPEKYDGDVRIMDVDIVLDKAA